MVRVGIRVRVRVRVGVRVRPRNRVRCGARVCFSAAHSDVLHVPPRCVWDYRGFVIGTGYRAPSRERAAQGFPLDEVPVSGAGATPGSWGRWGDLQCDLCFAFAHKGPVLSELALCPLGGSCRSAGPSTLIALPPLGRVHRLLSSKDRNRGVHVSPAAALRDGTTASGGLSAEAEPLVLAGHRQATPSLQAAKGEPLRRPRPNSPKGVP